MKSTLLSIARKSHYNTRHFVMRILVSSSLEESVISNRGGTICIKYEGESSLGSSYLMYHVRTSDNTVRCV